jgi:phage/plasmid-associated DNA primase
MQFERHQIAWRDLDYFENKTANACDWCKKAGLTASVFTSVRAALLSKRCIKQNKDDTYTAVSEPTREQYGWVDREREAAERAAARAAEAAARKKAAEEEKAAKRAEALRISEERTTERKKAVDEGTALARGSDVGIAEDFIETMLKGAVYAEGKFWKFDRTHWCEISQHTVEKKVHKYDGMSTGDGFAIFLGQGRIKSIIAIVTAKLAQPDFFAKAPAGFNCETGFIEFDEITGEPQLRKHEPHLRQRHLIPGGWHPSTSSDLSGLRALLRVPFKDDADADQKIDLLAEILGAAMLGKAAHRGAQAVWFIGEDGDNGKSTLQVFLNAGLPESATSSVPPNRFGKDYYAAQLSGKLLNTVAEVKALTIDGTVYKGIITGDRITGRAPYEPVCIIYPTAQHVFACNKLPTFQEGMGWPIQKRTLPLTFNRIIPKEERNDLLDRFPRKHPTEYLAFAVDGASRWLRNGKSFTVPASSKAALAKWVKDEDPVLGWVDERVAPPLGVVDEKPPFLTCRDAYQDFLGWALTAGWDIRDRAFPKQKGFVERLKIALRGQGILYTRNKSARGFSRLRLHPEPREQCDVMADNDELIHELLQPRPL